LGGGLLEGVLKEKIWYVYNISKTNIFSGQTNWFFVLNFLLSIRKLQKEDTAEKKTLQKRNTLETDLSYKDYSLLIKDILK